MEITKKQYRVSIVIIQAEVQQLLGCINLVKVILSHILKNFLWGNGRKTYLNIHRFTTVNTCVGKKILNTNSASPPYSTVQCNGMWGFGQWTAQLKLIALSPHRYTTGHCRVTFSFYVIYNQYAVLSSESFQFYQPDFDAQVSLDSKFVAHLNVLLLWRHDVNFYNTGDENL